MNQFAILHEDRFTKTAAHNEHRLSHHDDRFVASAARHRGKVLQRLEHKFSESLVPISQRAPPNAFHPEGTASKVSAVV